MYKEKSALFLLCETPLHAGSGDDLGLVDLPIQREKHTSFPKIESSSLKGALRGAFETMKVKDDKYQIAVHRIFGYDEAFAKNLKEEAKKNNPVVRYFGEDTQFSGCLALTDARLLFFPVKTMKGVFVWITCPQVLNKFKSDMEVAGVNIPGLDALTSLDISEGPALTASELILLNKAVVLEEFAFDATVSPQVTAFAEVMANIVFADDPVLSYWKALLPKNLVILNDTDFRDFTNMSTEVITRTKIDNETGAVEDGALFTEEYLPVESVMYSLVMASDENTKKGEKMSAEAVMKFFSDNLKSKPIFQLGGNATLGKGLLRTTLKKGGQNG